MGLEGRRPLHRSRRQLSDLDLVEGGCSGPLVCGSTGPLGTGLGLCGLAVAPQACPLSLRVPGGQHTGPLQAGLSIRDLRLQAQGKCKVLTKSYYRLLIEFRF